MSKIFISYKREDESTARLLAKALEERGHDVWWDRNLIAGDNFRNAIRNELTNCDVAVVIWTSKSVESDWVISEADFASKRRKLLPVRVGQDFELPFGHGQIHAEDMTDWSGDPEDAKVDQLQSHIIAIGNGNWRDVLFRAQDASREAKRFFESITTNVGGLPLPALFFGSVGIALIGTFITALGRWINGMPSPFMATLEPIFIIILMIAIIRVTFQFVYITAGRTRKRFFDSSFTLVFLFSSISSVLAWTLIMARVADAKGGLILLYGPVTALALLAMIALLQAAFIGGRILFMRL